MPAAAAAAAAADGAAGLNAQQQQQQQHPMLPPLPAGLYVGGDFESVGLLPLLVPPASLGAVATAAATAAAQVLLNQVSINWGGTVGYKMSCFVVSRTSCFPVCWYPQLYRLYSHTLCLFHLCLSQ
jgi:hypothetical protein